jgi:hypothetical protein
LDLKTIDVKTKWLMFRLLLGSDTTFKRNALPFQTFHELISTRNAIVHFKPSRLDGEKVIKKPFRDIVKDIETARSFYACITPMIMTLKDLTEGQTDIPDWFLNGARYFALINVSVSISRAQLASGSSIQRGG